MSAPSTADIEYTVSIPDDATADEAAAIVAAITAHLNDRERAAVIALATAAEKSEDDETRDGDRWAFAGRIDSLSGRRLQRVSDRLPRDDWSAAGRIGR